MLKTIIKQKRKFCYFQLVDDEIELIDYNYFDDDNDDDNDADDDGDVYRWRIIKYM